MAKLRKRGKVYQAIYYDAAGKRRWKTTHVADARAADAAARRFEREAHDPDNASAEDPTTLGDALEAMIGHYVELVKAGRKAEGTLDFHRDKATSLRFALEAGEPLLLSRLSATDIDGLISQRRQDGATENTISKELVTLRSTLKLATRQGKWHGDIKAILPIAFAPEYKPRERFLSRGELATLLSRLTEDHAARLAFEVATSANLGEAERATRADVGDTAVFVRGTKRTSRRRTVPLVTDWQRELVDFVREHAHGQDGRLFRFGGSYHNALKRACATCSTCGKRFDRERVCPQGDGKQHCAGLAHVSSNDLRRTFCHWMRQDGMPRELVAAAMGHGSTAMVDKVYGKLTPGELAALMQRALTGTPVAQSDAISADPADQAHSKKRLKVAKDKGLMVGRPGFEPGANGLKVRCSTG